jgi:hypothetical protein
MMNSVDHHGNAFWLQRRLQRVRHLLCHALLHRQPFRIEIDDPRQLADPRDIFPRPVRHMRAADYRHHVMFAVR